MIPINNSDTAWLIVSDYNQDKFNESNGGSVSRLVGGTMGIVDGISNAVGGDRFGHIGGAIGLNVGGWTNNGRKALSESVGGN